MTIFENLLCATFCMHDIILNQYILLAHITDLISATCLRLFYYYPHCHRRKLKY